MYKKSKSICSFILLVIDVFTRRAYAVPLKSKSGGNVADALDAVFKEANKSPLKITSDSGTEFLNEHVINLFKKKNIFH